VPGLSPIRISAPGPGEDLLRHLEELALLAPHLDDLDEVIFLGDLFDLLFASIEDAVEAGRREPGLVKLPRRVPGLPA